MRTASILLALIVVLGLVREAGALTTVKIDHDYRINLGAQQFGFVDGWQSGWGHTSNWCEIYIGPLGTHRVPFTATQGLIGFCLILATLIIVPAILTVRWRRRATV